MATITELKAKIADDINRTDLTSQISDAVQQAVDFYSVEALWFQEERASNTTEQGEPLYELPEDFLSLHTLYVTVNSAKYPLNQMQMAQFEARHIDDSLEGEPTDFTIYDQQIKLGPTPDAEYLLTMHYLRFIDPPSSGMNNYTERLLGQLINARAKHILYADTIRDPSEALVQRNREAEILGQIYKKQSLHNSFTKVVKYI